MKRCKYCGAICTEKGCPNSTCIAYTEPEQDVTQVTPKKRKIKKMDADNADTIEADIKR